MAAGAPNLPKLNKTHVTDHYDLGDQLGSGAYSVVVRATEKKTGRDWAIKIVNKESTKMDDMVAELAVMARLEHENIVHFKEVFDELDGFYVVMELINGGELFDRVIELRRFTEKDAAATVRQAFLALQHMHARALAHRDIKPENLLLSSKSSDATIKLADFGFAAQASTGDSGLIDLLGTPEYMAPELVRLRHATEGSYGRAVDVWALGVVLFVLLSGIHPFQQEDEEAMLDNIEHARWKWLGRNWDKVSEEGKDLINLALTADPAKRPTVEQCLQHPWFSNQLDVSLQDVADELKKFQARKRLRGAINTVIASNKMRGLLGKFKATGKPAAPSATGKPAPAGAAAPAAAPKK